MITETERKIVLTLTEEELAELDRQLTSIVGDTRVELRRTESPKLHDEILHEEHVLESLLRKVRQLRI